jgi:molybdenum cofactor biosynthesis protein B
MDDHSSSQQHKTIAAQQGKVAIAIVTVSDTRTPDTDVNAAYLREQITAAGHTVAAYRLIKDEQIKSRRLDDLVPQARIILFNGGRHARAIAL